MVSMFRSIGKAMGRPLIGESNFRISNTRCIKGIEVKRHF